MERHADQVICEKGMVYKRDAVCYCASERREKERQNTRAYFLIILQLEK